MVMRNLDLVSHKELIRLWIVVDDEVKHRFDDPEFRKKYEIETSDENILGVFEREE